MLTASITPILRTHIRAGATVIVAVSGGMDSMALLHALLPLRETLQLSLHVATFDHGLRAEAGAADAQFVAEQAQAWKLSVTIGRGDVIGIAQATGDGIEAAARRARYDFLARTAQQVGAAAVLTGHHAGDQAETVLMRVLRGTGITGLRGMAVRASVPGHADVPLLRPLLAVTQTQISQYCAEHDIAYREDSTNEDTRFLRNRLRHTVMPVLREVNPQLDAALLRLADNAATDDDYLQAAFASLRDRHLHTTTRAGITRASIDRTAFRNWHPAMQRRAVIYAVEQAGAQPPDFARIMEAVRLGEGGDVGAMSLLGGGLRLRVDYEALVVEPIAAPDLLPDQAALLQPGQQVRVRVPGVTPIPGADWSLHVIPADAITPCPGAMIPLLSTAEIILRTRQPGDRFHPTERGGRSRSVKQWMIDHKIKRALRDHLPILVVNGTIRAILSPNQWQIDAKAPDSAEVLTMYCVFVNYS